jgi:hypothetical protein
MLLPINCLKNVGSSASKKLATGDQKGGGLMSMMINLKAKLMGIKELIKLS